MFTASRTSLKLRIASGRTLPAIWCALGAPVIVEAAARAKPEVIVLDKQHGLFDRSTLEAAIGLVPPDVSAMVRVAENSETAIGEALDAGAEGVIVPLVETAKQARRAVRYAHFPPFGERSGGGVRPLAEFGGYFERAKAHTVVAVMIETRRGVKNAREIARVPGVDMVFIGTGDLAISVGSFPDFDLKVMRAAATVHRACRKAWTPCGIFTPNAGVAAMRRAHGYRMVVVANDIEVVAKGFADAMKAFASAPSRPPVPTAAGELPTIGT
ncbi:MAG: aldolase/citrate lyase family protein [Hyphomicrobiaceae bacterium]